MRKVKKLTFFLPNAAKVLLLMIAPLDFYRFVFVFWVSLSAFF